jgi:hypothetical protein
MGLIAMSERDLQRIEILSKVIGGRMTLVSAAHVLDLSPRQVRRLLERISTGGAASIRHKAIGRPSNNRISDGVRDYAMTLVRERYADFGPTPRLLHVRGSWTAVLAAGVRRRCDRQADAAISGATNLVDANPGLRRDFMNDPTVIARRRQALSDLYAAE